MTPAAMNWPPKAMFPDITYKVDRRTGIVDPKPEIRRVWIGEIHEYGWAAYDRRGSDFMLAWDVSLSEISHWLKHFWGGVPLVTH